MIVSLHVASGALAGAVCGSRTGALALAPLLHLAGDLVPHRDSPSTAFELASGAAAVLAIAARRGVLDPATLGAVAAAAPDAEHVVPFPRPGGRKLFPSHRYPAWHHRGGIPAFFQVVLAAALLTLVLRRRAGRPAVAATRR